MFLLDEDRRMEGLLFAAVAEEQLVHEVRHGSWVVRHRLVVPVVLPDDLLVSLHGKSDEGQVVLNQLQLVAVHVFHHIHHQLKQLVDDGRVDVRAGQRRVRPQDSLHQVEQEQQDEVLHHQLRLLCLLEDLVRLRVVVVHLLDREQLRDHYP